MYSCAKTDRVAVVFSMACIAHCVALPVTAISLPFQAIIAEAEWVHWLLTVLAVGATAMIITSPHTSLTLRFLIPVKLGLFFLIGALFAESFGVGETVPTVIGGVFLATAHFYRLFKYT